MIYLHYSILRSNAHIFRVSSPVQKDGHNKTTSTSDILTYHPAKEELLAQSLSEDGRTTTPSSSNTVYELVGDTISNKTANDALHVEDMPTSSGSTTEDRNSLVEMEVVPHVQSAIPLQNSAPPLPERAPFTPPPAKRNSMSKINYDTNEDLPPPMPPRNIASPKSYTDLLSAPTPSSPKPAVRDLAPPSPKPAPEITLIPENLYDPMHIGTTYMLLSKKYHGMFKFSNPDDPNDTKTPPTPTLKPTPSKSKRTLYQPKSYAPSPKPAVRDQAARAELYTPYSLSMTSLPRPHSPPTKLKSEPVDGPYYDTYDPPRSPADDPRYVSVLPPVIPSPSTSRKQSTESVPMSPENRRKFNRPYKSELQNYREMAVDCGVGAPPDLIAAQKTPVLERRDPALREYMLNDLIRDQRPSPEREGLSPDCGYTREPLPFSSPSLYNSTSSLRMQIPNVEFAGEEWKELAQCLGFDNMTICNIHSEYPNPGLAMIEMWAKQPGSELEELMYHLKRMGMWNQAATLDRTTSPISV